MIVIGQHVHENILSCVLSVVSIATTILNDLKLKPFEEYSILIQLLVNSRNKRFINNHYG